MMLQREELRPLPLVSPLQPLETRAGLIAEGLPFLQWEKGLVPKEKKLGETDCS